MSDERRGTQDTAASIPEAAIAALSARNKVEAIKILREATGLGLKEAKDAVERYEAGETPSLPQASRPVERGAFPLAAVSALQNGKLIDAIRIVREARGIGLKDAKQEVERYLESEPLIRSRFRAAHSESRRGLLLWVIALVLLAVLVAYFLGKH